MATATLAASSDGSTVGGWTCTTFVGNPLTLTQVCQATVGDLGDTARGVGGADTSAGFVLLDDTPSNFATVTALSVTIRHGSNAADDTETIFLQVMQSDETTALTEEVSHVSVAGFVSGSQYTLPFSTLNNASDKALWDGAVLRIRATHASVMGNDGQSSVFNFLNVNMTYTAAVSDARSESISGPSTAVHRAASW